MVKVVNQILEGRDLDIAVQDRVVSSIVFFSAIHYRGLTDGPDFKFALNVGNPDWSRPYKDSNEPLTPKEEREKRWESLMQELGIYACDEFEKHLVEFFESGLLDTGGINIVIDRYVAESEVMNARLDAHRYIKRVLWDHRVSEAQLVDEASCFPKSAQLLDGSTATELHSVITNLPGGPLIAEQIIDSWISGCRLRGVLIDDNPFNNRLHPKIEAEYKAIEASRHANTTVVDACIYVFENDGWGTLQEIALGNATAVDIEYAIREIDDLDKLRKFMRQMIKMRTQRSTYDVHFGTATEHFVEACRKIVNDPESPRLARLIKQLFEAGSLISELGV